MNMQKVSQYFFIIAAVISILDGAFTLDENMTSIKIIFLLIAGLVVGILRHDQKEKEFVIAGIAVIFTGLIFSQLLASYPVMQNFARMIGNFIIFLSTAVIVVGIEIISEIVALPSDDDKKEKQQKHELMLKHLTEEEIKKIAFQRIWGTVILIAVALTFIILLAESFFDVSQFSDAFLIADGVITILFIVDLVILYNDSKNFSTFLRNNIFDIISSIPTVGILRPLKLFRAIRIIKFFKGTTKLTKLSKLYKTTKFFSEESYFNKVNDGTLGVEASLVKEKSSASCKTPKKKASVKKVIKKKSSVKKKK